VVLIYGGLPCHTVGNGEALTEEKRTLEGVMSRIKGFICLNLFTAAGSYGLKRGEGPTPNVCEPDPGEKRERRGKSRGVERVGQMFQPV